MNSISAIDAQARTDIVVRRSFGQTKTGIPIFFVRPAQACFNRSRRCIGYDKMNKVVEKWFSPAVLYYLVDDHVIGSNSEKNALLEYHRVCVMENVGKLFKVETIASL
jgi:hypothetical protein